MDKLRSEVNTHLFKAILELKTVDECYDFFEDLCTITEIISMAQRLKVAEMLNDNKVYSEIAAETGASTATISRVNRCLQYGNNGYNTILERLSKD